MKCSKCGYDNDMNNIRCVNCGNILERNFNYKENNKSMYYLFQVFQVFIIIFGFVTIGFGIYSLKTSQEDAKWLGPNTGMVLFVGIMQIIAGFLMVFSTIRSYFKKKKNDNKVEETSTENKIVEYKEMETINGPVQLKMETYILSDKTATIVAGIFISFLAFCLIYGIILAFKVINTIISTSSYDSILALPLALFLIFIGLYGGFLIFRKKIGDFFHKNKK